jgi:hypothetical protein
MWDKLMDKIIESTTSAYLPRIKQLTEERYTELIDIKLKVRTNPEEVEAWFDKEIKKLSEMDIKDLMNKVNAPVET